MKFKSADSTYQNGSLIIAWIECDGETFAEAYGDSDEEALCRAKRIARLLNEDETREPADGDADGEGGGMSDHESMQFIAVEPDGDSLIVKAPYVTGGAPKVPIRRRVQFGVRHQLDDRTMFVYLTYSQVAELFDWIKEAIKREPSDNGTAGGEGAGR